LILDVKQHSVIKYIQNIALHGQMENLKCFI